MMFWNADNLRGVMRGDWLRPPARHLHVSGVGIDAREDLAGRVFFAIRGARHDGHDFIADAAARSAALAVIERELDAQDIDIPVMRVPSTRHALADLARAWRQTLAGACVIAVTGSAGKTTTKHFIHAILSSELRGTCAPKSYNNDIGVPLTILSAGPEDCYILLEVGTNAPGEIESLGRIAEPDIAVITSIGRAHLEGLGNIKNVLAEKGFLFRCVRGDGLCIYPAEHPALRSFIGRARALTFSDSVPADLRIAERAAHGPPFEFVLHDGRSFAIRLAGGHNARNALAAIAVADAFGVNDDVIRRALGDCAPPPMRMTRHEIAGIVIYNDAYNANPESMAASLEAFVELTAKSGPRIAILGDMLELGDQSEALHHELGVRLGRLIAEGALDRAVIAGSFAPYVARGARNVAPHASVEISAAIDSAALARMASQLEPGDQVLIKGSRAVGLERILDLLTTQRARPPVPA